MGNEKGEYVKPTTIKGGNDMNAREFFNLVSAMRSAQKAYFKSRYGHDEETKKNLLNESKDLERQVDLEIIRVNGILSKRNGNQG